MQTSVNVEVLEGESENSLSVLRRFTKRVQAAGVLPRVRSKRYSKRIPSRNTRRTKTVFYLKKKEEVAELIKLGKVSLESKFAHRR